MNARMRKTLTNGVQLLLFMVILPAIIVGWIRELIIKTIYL